VILSAIAGASVSEQLVLVAAAQLAGVRWFVPSEFGYDVAARKLGSPAESLLIGKEQVLQAVKDAGLDWTVFNTVSGGTHGPHRKGGGERGKPTPRECWP